MDDHRVFYPPLFLVILQKWLDYTLELYLLVFSNLLHLVPYLLFFSFAFFAWPIIRSPTPGIIDQRATKDDASKQSTDPPQDNDAVQTDPPGNHEGQVQPDEVDFIRIEFQKKIREGEEALGQVNEKLSSTTEELHREQSKNSRPVQSIHRQDPLAHEHFEQWQAVDLKPVFATLDDTVRTLAKKLWHRFRENKLMLYPLSRLYARRNWLQGVDMSLFTERRDETFRAVIWQVLIETIFSHDFKVFGEDARKLSQEMDTDPKIAWPRAGWRRVTAEMLLMRTGLLQFSATMPKRPQENLRDILDKDRSIEDLLASANEALIKKHGRAEADKIAKSLFEDVNGAAFQSVRDARAEFTKSLECITSIFYPEKTLPSLVHRLFVDAQVLAILMATQSHTYQFPKSRMGETFQAQAEMQAITKVNRSPGGTIVFTMNPGFQKFEDSDAKQMTVVCPTVVYVTGVAMPKDEEPRAAPQPPAAPTDLVEENEKIKKTFGELINDIQTFAEALRYSRSKEVRLAKVGTLPSDWDERTQDTTATEVLIWRSLYRIVFKEKFKCYGIRGIRAREEWFRLHPGIDEQKPRTMSTAANDWRSSEGVKLVSRLGDPSFFTDPYPTSTPDPGMHISRKATKFILCVHIGSYVEEVREDPPAPGTPTSTTVYNDIEEIVQKAMMLSALLDIQKHHYGLWRPPKNSPFDRENHDFFLTSDCAHLERGKTDFVVHPALRVNAAEDMRVATTVVPALAHIVGDNGGIPSSQSSASGAKDKNKDPPIPPPAPKPTDPPSKPPQWKPWEPSSKPTSGKRTDPYSNPLRWGATKPSSTPPPSKPTEGPASGAKDKEKGKDKEKEKDKNKDKNKGPPKPPPTPKPTDPPSKPPPSKPTQGPSGSSTPTRDIPSSPPLPVGSEASDTTPPPRSDGSSPKKSPHQATVEDGDEGSNEGGGGARLVRK